METPSTDPEVLALWERYRALGHALQSGVAFTMPIAPKETEPKHLRVGINIALSDGSALVRLLIAKGLITEREYVEAVIAGLEAEVESYKARLAAHYGMPVDSITLQ